MTAKRGSMVIAAVLAAIALAGAIALGAGTAERSAIADMESGELCAGCHESPGSGGPHEDESCGSCHRIDDSLAQQLFYAHAGFTEPPEHGRVRDRTCNECHDATELSADGHRQHRGEVTCTRCHENTHVDEPAASCDGCHGELPRHGPTADLACTTCHAFGAADLDQALEGTNPSLAGLEATADFATRLHSTMDCRRCHDPHEETQAPVNCTSCHRGAIVQQRDSGPEAHRDCNDCHRAHGDREQPAVECIGCHMTPVEGGGWEAHREGVSAEDRQRTREHVTHEGNCGTCHAPHTWRAEEARCAECHDENAASIAALPDGTHERCVGCHEPHSPRPTGAICTTCHEDVHVASAGTPRQHQNCLSCHDAHQGRPDASACASCHRSEHAATVGRPAQHRACLSCHENHGPPLRGTRERCASCHAQEVGVFARAAGAPAQHQCASCHVPHAFAAGRTAVTRCASCHSNAVDGNASHRGACTSCHEQHGAPVGRATDCRSCHSAVRPAVAQHNDCANCHRPHTPAARATETCRTCHAAAARTAASWPAGSPHRGQCATCHRPHNETQRATCESCHAPQMSRTHTGGHANCVGCHAPHRDRPAGAQSWWSRCADCHQQQASAVSRSTGTHAQCSGCHQTPGPPLPSCVNCHSATPRRLTHQAHANVACSNCHATHGPSQIVRTTCMTSNCHQDRASHFPDAPRCQSCHPFAR